MSQLDTRKTLKPIPTFRNEAEERLFWETHASVDYVDWSNAERVPPSQAQASGGREHLLPKAARKR
ncbi:CopG family antitoxin [Chelativorans salis]|uniref:CopG family antitoxin n=1 Tax=Chelativorans salis TaxID=2978478 RepID=UPI003CC5730E